MIRQVAMNMTFVLLFNASVVYGQSITSEIRGIVSDEKKCTDCKCSNPDT